MKASVSSALAFLVAGALFAPVCAEPAGTQPSPEVLRSFFGPWTANVGGPQRPAGQAPAEAAPPVSTVNDRRFPPALEARLTPRSKAAYLKFKDLASKVVEKEAPTPDNNCLPFAMPGETVTTGWPMSIQVTPKVIGILMNIDNQMRFVYMNKQHPADLKPSFHGHSVGHWEGDTLVIDTVGFDERAQFNDGFIHGPGLHVVERYRLTEGGKTLEKTFTFTDPDALTEPYTFTRTVHRMEQPFQEYVNAQNNTLYACPTDTAGSNYRPVQ